MTNPVLVGIDGSPQSFVAARWAGREAAARGLPVLLLNVWQAPAGNVQFSPDPEGLRFWEETRVREAGKELTDLHPGLSVSARQESGPPMSVLLEAAAGAELTVLGSRGLGAVRGFFQGSVGLHLAARSDRPVVTVRGGAGADIGQMDTVDRDVVLALDLDRPCGPLIAFALESAAARHAAVHAVHIWDVHRMYGYAAPSLDPELARELREERSRLLATTLAPWRRHFPGVVLRESVIAGPVAQSLVAVADRAGVLAVGRRRTHPAGAVRIGPVAHAALHHAACPVAVVPHD
ncbi:Nucleotide-binding universal stress protein, UspA family [Actinacidiphila alni]|uniref:Nucleotide-binding universal stress protein, UspA family n=1 Tax=Actinacidiphila alni TaxID=380248 RepID=A0A1I2HU21_9ACTN|nr:universal stress protein [Actinacidiphila alni]SFF31921.1 Nucleotide-binding universal stress protein, UspA family [Actinacidiphila alni]